MSGLSWSDLATSDLLVSGFATIALDVSCISGRAGDTVLATGMAGWTGLADANFVCPALTWTVFTLTGFIGSEEPGIVDMAWLWITPDVSGAGSGLACGTEAAAA